MICVVTLVFINTSIADEYDRIVEAALDELVTGLEIWSYIATTTTSESREVVRDYPHAKPSQQLMSVDGQNPKRRHKLQFRRELRQRSPLLNQPDSLLF